MIPTSSIIPSSVSQQSCAVCKSPEYKPLFYIHPRRIVECRNCGHEYVNPIPPEKSLPELIRKEDDEFIQSQMDVTYLDKVFERYSIKKGKLLDIGSGKGRIEIKLIESGWSQENLYLLDTSQKLLQLASQKYPLANMILGDAEQDLGFNDFFDCALMIELLEHVKNPAIALGNALDTLKQGGILVVRGLPNNRSLEAYLGLENWSMRQFSHHHNFFNPATFSQFMGNFPQAQILEFGTFLQNSYKFYDIFRIARNIGLIKRLEDGRYYSYGGKPLEIEEVADLVLAKLKAADFNGYSQRDKLPGDVKKLSNVEEVEDFFKEADLDPELSPDFSVVIGNEKK